jgi:hypothetical protein
VKRPLAALDAFWFVEGSATRLAVLRIVVGVAALAYVGPRFTYFSEISGSPPDLFEPAGIVTLLSAPIPVRLFQVIMACMLIANLAFILGWRFQRTGPLFAGLFLWVLCYRNSWSMVYHYENLIVLQVLILGLTRSADALSLDALRGPAPLGPTPDLAERGDASPPETATSASGWHWEYGYPIMLICAVTAVTYFLSGTAKLAEAGWGWALGDGLRSQVATDALRKELIATGATPLAFVIFSNPALATIPGIGTLVLELGAPLALLGRRLAVVWAVSTFAMHWGILAIMGIVFWYHLSGLAFLPFLLDEKIVAWGRARADAAMRWLRSARWRAPSVTLSPAAPSPSASQGTPIADLG